MGEYDFTSWAMQLALLILVSNLYGKIFREWVGASKLPRKIVHIGMIIIIIATLIITYGNYLGEKNQPEPEPSTPTIESIETSAQMQNYMDIVINHETI